MSAHGIADKFKQAIAGSGTPRRMLLRLKLHQVGYEIGFPDPPRLDTFLNILTRLR